MSTRSSYRHLSLRALVSFTGTLHFTEAGDKGAASPGGCDARAGASTAVASSARGGAAGHGGSCSLGLCVAGYGAGHMITIQSGLVMCYFWWRSKYSQV